MTKEQTVWAAGHDWFRGLVWCNVTKSYGVTVWCSTEKEQFTIYNYQELRRWAGY